MSYSSPQQHRGGSGLAKGTDTNTTAAISSTLTANVNATSSTTAASSSSSSAGIMSFAVSSQVEFERICEGITSIEEVLGDIAPTQSSITLLNLHGNMLTSTTNFPRMASLRSLILSSNHIVSCDMCELPCFTSLISLDLSSNRISKICSLPFLPGLESLFLSFNFIDNLTSINENCPNIQKLDVRGNRLKTPVAFLPLQGCGSLTSLLLASKESPNPICEDASKIPFFPKLFELIPNLCILDSKTEIEWNAIIANSNSLMVETPKFDKLLEKMKSRWSDEGKDEENVNISGDNNSNSNNGTSNSNNGTSNSNSNINSGKNRSPIKSTPNSKMKRSLNESTNNSDASSSSESNSKHVNNKLYLTIAAPDSNILMSEMAHNKPSSSSSNSGAAAESVLGTMSSSSVRMENGRRRGGSNNVHIQIQPLSASQDKGIPLSSKGGGAGIIFDTGVQCNLGDSDGVIRDDGLHPHRSTVSVGNSPININFGGSREAFVSSSNNTIIDATSYNDVSTNTSFVEADGVDSSKYALNINSLISSPAATATTAVSNLEDLEDHVDHNSISSRGNGGHLLPDILKNVSDLGVGTDILSTNSCGINTSFDNKPLTSSPLAKVLIRNAVKICEEQCIRSAFTNWAHAVVISNLRNDKDNLVEIMRLECSRTIEELSKSHESATEVLIRRHQDSETELRDTIDKLRISSDAYRENCDLLKLEVENAASKLAETTNIFETAMSRKDEDNLQLQRRIDELEMLLKTCRDSADQRIVDEVDFQTNLRKEEFNVQLDDLQKEREKAIADKELEIQTLQSKSSKRIQLLKNVMDELKVSNADLVERNESLSKKTGQFVAVMNEMKTMIKQLKDDLSKSQSRNIELSTLLESDRGHFNDEKSTLLAKVHSLETRLVERQQEVVETRQKFEAERASYDLTHKASDSSKKKLQDNLSDMYKRLDSAEREMKSLISEISILRRSDQEKSMALKVKEKMLTDSQHSCNGLKLKISTLEGENSNLSKKVESLDDSYHRLKEEYDFIEDQLQVKSGAEQDMMELLSNLERNKDVKTKKAAGGSSSKASHRSKGKSSNSGLDENEIKYVGEEEENENNSSRDEEDVDEEDSSINGEFDAKSGKILFGTKSGDRRSGKASANNVEDEDDIIHRLFNKSVVCSKRKCRAHLNYLENELKLKDDIILELKLGKL